MANDYMDSDAGGSTTTSSTASAGTDHGLLLVWLTIGYILVLAALLYPLTVLVRKVRKYRKSASRKARSVAKEHLLPVARSKSTDTSSTSSADSPKRDSNDYVSPTLPSSASDKAEDAQHCEQDLIELATLPPKDPCGENTEVSGEIEMGLGLDGAGTSIDKDELGYVSVVLPVS